ncbi:serine protease FAM111A-like isoform X2 [Narcine bancroftii]|uniref:serine protease FAM111A-like isoform X2 n=1 Tax=Narcine bancroftii TaxID=1343680 RepID=UPI003831571A
MLPGPQELSYNGKVQQLKNTRSKMASDALPRDKRKLQSSRCTEEFVPKNGKILKNDDQFDSGICVVQNLPKKEFTFSVCGDPDNIQYAFTGDPDDTLLFALNSSCDFEEKVRSDSTVLIYGEGPLKGLVNFDILCRYLPQLTHFRLLFLRAPGRDAPERPALPHSWPERRHVLFYVEPSGRTTGNTTLRIVLTDRIAQGQTKLCVLGFEGDTIRQALTKDGRFDPRVDDDTHKLLEKVDPPRKIQFNNVVDGLHDRSFQVEMSSAKKKQPFDEASKNSKPKFSKQADVGKKEADGRGPDAGRHPLPRWHVEARRAAMLKFKQTISRNAELGGMSERQYLNRLHQEAQSPIPAHAIRRVAERFSSVGCLIWRSPTAQGGGTCFLLKDRYILTCYHAVEMLAEGVAPERWPSIIQDFAQVYFTYEEDGQRGRPLKLTGWLELYDQALDYALLELETSPGVPGLMELCIPPPETGNLYIAGHPDGEIKKVCPCSVMCGDRQGAGEASQHLDNLRAVVTREDAESYLPDMVLVASYAFNRVRHPNMVPFKADFHHGASGSPIFNSEGCVVGLHCGGEIQKKNKDPEKFYIELGRSIMLIIRDIIHKSDITTEKSKQIVGALQSYFK